MEGSLAAGVQASITAATGERANPVRLAFAKGTGMDADVLVADKPLPEGGGTCRWCCRSR